MAEKLGLVAKISGYTLVIILILAFAGLATFSILSDNSIHGLTVKFYNVTWACSSNSTSPNPVLVYTFNGVVVYSSTSIPTSLSSVTFSMSTNGIAVSTVTAHDASFGPGQSAPYTLTFSNPALNPPSQPLSSQIGLSINAVVSAGLYSSQASASDSHLVGFPSQAC
jgi:hypothetical protein